MSSDKPRVLDAGRSDLHKPMVADGGPIAGTPRRGLLRSSQDFGAGIFLLLIAGVALVGGANLNFGQLSSIGPGMLPRAVAILIAGFGVLLVVSSFVTDGDPLTRWRIRGPLFVLGAVLVFAGTIRELGLAVSGPLAVIISAFADTSTRIIETIIFALIMTVFCIGLFKYGLRLPIPVLPFNMTLPGL